MYNTSHIIIPIAFYGTTLFLYLFIEQARCVHLFHADQYQHASHKLLHNLQQFLSIKNWYSIFTTKYMKKLWNTYFSSSKAWSRTFILVNVKPLDIMLMIIDKKARLPFNSSRCIKTRKKVFFTITRNRSLVNFSFMV